MVEPEDEMQLQSPLAILLLHKFAWGRLAASEVQQYADTAVKSGATGADLLTLQKLGGHGSSKNNCHRDLVRAFFKNMVAPQPVEIETLVKVKNCFGAVQEESKKVPVILPHEWVKVLGDNNLLEHLTCSKVALANFWKRQDWDNNPQLQCCKKFWQKVKRALV